MNLLLKKEVFFVKFPILFPLVYLTALYSFPSFETHLIFLTILILAETHFGATWPFFLDKVNAPYIKKKKDRINRYTNTSHIILYNWFFLF